MRALESEKEFSKWLLDIGNAKEGDVLNLPEIWYHEVQDPIAQHSNDLDFRDVPSKQLKDKAILAVTNDISLAFNNQVLNILPGDKVACEEMDKINDDSQDQLTLKSF